MDNQSRFFAATYTWIKDMLSLPVFEDEEKSRIARILGIILWAIVTVVGAMIVTWLATGKSNELGPCAFLANGVIIAVSIGLLFLIHHGHVKPAGLIFVIFLWANITFQAFTSDGVRGSAAIIYMTIMVLAGLLVGWKTSIGFAVLSIIFIWILAHAEMIGFTTFQLDGAYEVALEATGMFILIAILLTLTTTGLSTALQRARRSEQSLRESNRALKKNLAELAQREEELRESEERFRVIFEHAPDPFFFLKPDGALFGGNKAGQKLTGYRDGELVGKNILEIGLIAAEDLLKAGSFLKRSLNGEPDRFDLVITDMTMPGLTGDQLAQKLMEIRSDLPVILCTGFSARINEEKALALGIRAFITKPVLKRQIAETIRKVLDESSGYPFN